MHTDSLVFGSLTLLMVFGAVVMILGLTNFGNAVVIGGGALLVAGIMLMARHIAVLDGPDHGEEAGH